MMTQKTLIFNKVFNMMMPKTLFFIGPRAQGPRASREARRRWRREQQQGLDDRARGIVERRSAEERAQLEEEFAKSRGEWETSVKNGSE